MASSGLSRPVAAGAASEANALTLTLQIISPSVGVPQPLSFREVPASTTVRQLKEKIRNALDTKPTDQAQRLIHRGRLLVRDDETMLELFGEEAFRSTEHQSLHLVLRDLSDTRPAFTPTPAATITNQPTALPPGQQQQQQQHSQPQAQAQPQAQPQQPHQNHLPFFHAQPQIRAGAGPPQHPNSLFGLPQPQFGGVNQNAQWPPAWTQHHIAQNHRHIMATVGMGVGNQHQPNQAPPVGFGMQGMQIPQGRGTPGVTTPGRNASPFQPEATRTVIREGFGPNGQQWRITVNEALINPMQRPVRTGSPFPTADLPVSSGPTLRSTPSNRHLSGSDVQNILQTADATSATRTMTDAMRRNASSSSLANLATNPAHQPIPPGVTTPLVQSRTGTPDPLRAAGRTRNAPTSHPQVQSSSGTPEVYILSSPSGPRALLLNSSLDTYVSPQIRETNPALAYAFQPRPFAPPLGALPYGVPQYFQPQRFAMAANATNPQPTRTAQPQQPQRQQHGLAQPPRAQPHLGHAMARPDNPQIQAVRIAQVWPHVWMIIRLALFIWWFTSPSSSWSRWITVISIAITLFLVNTGLLNPITEQVWVPIRRHLENLIPLADGHGARHDAHPAEAENAQGANGQAGNRDRQGEPNPADAAARLVQQRRQQNANWLLNQARRLERAGLLFLASIAPGVAERHIAHLEAEARAEQQRREAAAEAAAAAAAAQSENAGATEGEQTNENNSSSESGAGETTSQHQEVNNENAGNNNPPAVEEPLIAI
ncbi:hypothetical protein F4775DRAFT_556948 [Biscogniauxia sp. FL1348]|nr:hypothetical protein F4775DRAFT_556948 [Biscogniauxia sp. FL1348]